MEFGIKIYGYDPLLSKEEIENFGAKTLSFSFSTGFLFKISTILETRSEIIKMSQLRNKGIGEPRIWGSLR